jgi:uncharacterized FlaG/YvyC family protein
MIRFAHLPAAPEWRTTAGATVQKAHRLSWGSFVQKLTAVIKNVKEVLKFDVCRKFDILVIKVSRLLLIQLE